jgi:hypothetical protein
LVVMVIERGVEFCNIYWNRFLRADKTEMQC